MTAPVNAEIRQQVNQVFLQLFELNEADLLPERQLYADLGLDSLDGIDMMIHFQKHFRIRPPAEEIQAIRTMQDVYDLVARYQHGVGGDAAGGSV